ncbi:MAG: 3-phosphoglycerate dehydrogenase [Clostridia bacterium]|nr:3-phosphoglycerate dehydrogenase [Clostridia bacterium]
MYKIQKLNDISPLIYNELDNKYTVEKDVVNPDAVLVRSAVMNDYLIGSNLVAVARAGAGVNNIPLDKMSEAGVVVFNTPGANANAVKELIITSMLLANRDIIGGVNWTQSLAGQVDAAKQVESGKKAFIGPEIFGKTLGIIGLGAIGALVANAAIHLGMNIIGYDPYLSGKIAATLNKAIEITDNLDFLYANSDYITLHVPLNDGTRNMINTTTIAMMKDNVRIINAARGELVDNTAIIESLNLGKVAKYVTDFPNAEVIGKHANIITIPHLGASTPEAEDNCAIMAASQLKIFIENGNIVNSVNYPNMTADKTGKYRVTVLAKENVLSEVIAALTPSTIKGSLSGSRGVYNYYIIDTESKPEESAIAELSKNALKVRLLG